jgi:pyruvate formate lyase activating enzyme
MADDSFAGEDLVPGRFWHQEDDGRFACDLCPRRCTVRPGQRAFCYVRVGTEEGIALATYGRSSGFCIDPIEKKPLNHFFPGTSVFSFGTAGCNLGCKYCQNWDISKAKTQDRLLDRASPQAIAEAAAQNRCRSVAFTYNDPVIFAEYALDTADACHALNLKTVAVTAGYITAEARPEFFSKMDAANIDLKAFTEEYYRKNCLGHLKPVLETIEYVALETQCHLELTTLIIPGHNDSDAELHRMAQWVVEKLGPDVPMHFSAFHPDFKMLDVPSTPMDTLSRARRIARENGVRHAFTGNVHDQSGSSTYCPNCGETLIERDWYVLGAYRIKNGACATCETPIAGHFDDEPGTWGSRRKSIRILSH